MVAETDGDKNMSFICRTCKEGFSEQYALQQIRIDKRSPMCPKGHTLKKLSGPVASFLLGAAGILVLSLNIKLMMISVHSRSSWMVMIVLWTLIAVSVIAASIVRAFRYRNTSFPLNRISRSATATTLGALAVVIITLTVSWFGLRPVNNSDLIIYPGNFVGQNFSVQGKVRWVTAYPKDGYALFELDNNVTIQTDNLDRLPKEGEEVQSFGHGYINQKGGLTIDEYMRMQ